MFIIQPTKFCQPSVQNRKSLNVLSLIKPWLLITTNYVCKPIKTAINVTAQINRAERRERGNVVNKLGNSAVFAHFVKGIYAVWKKKCFDIHGWNCMELAAVLVEVFPNACASAFARSFFHRRKVLILDQFRVSHAVWPARWVTSNINFAFDVTAGKKIPSELIFSASVPSFVTPSRPQISYKSWLERHHANVDLEECRSFRLQVLRYLPQMNSWSWWRNCAWVVFRASAVCVHFQPSSQNAKNASF